MIVRRTAIAVFALTLATAAGCEDPAANKPKAEVGEAKPIPTGGADAKPGGSAEASAKPAEGDSAEKPAGGEKATVERPAGAVDLASDSTIGFTGSKVTGSHDGKFEKFEGWLALEDGKVEGGQVYVAIDMSTVKTDDEKLDDHLQSDDFFLVEEHPKASFVTTSIKAGGEGGATHTVEGNLEMRGETKSVTFPATIDESGENITAKAEFSINRKDWGIAYDGKKDDLIRDDVVIKLDLKAPKS